MLELSSRAPPPSQEQNLELGSRDADHTRGICSGGRHVPNGVRHVCYGHHAVRLVRGASLSHRRILYR